MLLLKKNNDGHTVLHDAAKNPKGLEILLESEVFKTLGKEEQKLLFSEQNNYGNIVLHHAAANNHESFQILLESEAFKSFSREEQKLLLLEKNKDGDTVLCYAAVYNSKSFKVLLESEVLKALWREGQQRLLFIEKDNDDKTVLHRAAAANSKSLKVLLESEAFKVLSKEERYKLLFFEKDIYGKTVLYRAASDDSGSFKVLFESEVFQALGRFVQQNLLFFEKDIYGITILRKAIYSSENFKVLLNSKPFKALTKGGQHKLLFFEKNKDGQTVLQMTATSSSENLKVLLESEPFKVFIKKEQYKLLFLEKDQSGRTVCDNASGLSKDLLLKHKAVLSGKGVVASSINTSPEGIHESFLKYYEEGIDQLLLMRLNDLAIDSKITVLKANYLLETDTGRIDNLLDDIIAELNRQNNSANAELETQKILIPMNIDRKHWVGLVVSASGDSVALDYVDPANHKINSAFKFALTSTLENTGYKVTYSHVSVEGQRYGNCGPEVIENFIYYLTGQRATQENAVYLHSLLLENSMLNQSTSVDQIESNKRIIESLSSQIVSDKIENIV